VHSSQDRTEKLRRWKIFNKRGTLSLFFLLLRELRPLSLVHGRDSCPKTDAREVQRRRMSSVTLIHTAHVRASHPTRSRWCQEGS